MNNDLHTLLEFLDRCGPEVTGHALPAPETKEAMKLERLAAGLCTESERTELWELLRFHPAWRRWLAERVKMARDRTAAGTPL